MKILAIDSSALTAAAAICEDERLLAQTTVNAARTHSETLLPMINALLSSLSLNIDDIDLLACSAGPGSFTGVRIGVALIKGLAFPKSKPCVGVSTLDALARNLLPLANSENDIVCPVMDARRSQVYNAIWRGGKRLCDDRLITLEALEAELSKFPADSKIRFCGDGAYLAAQKITLANAVVAPDNFIWQNGYSVAAAALEKYRNGETVTGEQLAPVYLRASQAERERAQKQE